ncbi:hypothetical protein COY62_00295 [bacterium (Candidatus Howlettbacteria) CG_4_10_14_0_8_um_filter_40_9]|nr:MAG: hypothetical protein COY62_00295 [bacterium (Candidatus Howlettbacteria) CG_4_10_14_0_8_um_filter_40_9]
MAEKKDKLKIIQQLLTSAKNSIQSADQIIRNLTGTSSDAVSRAKEKAKDLSSFDGEKVVEGVFDGVSMIGPDEKEYKVPENYASKSKLVQGDVLKLTISDDGSFIFKQIGPVARKKVIGTLIKETTGFRVVAEGKSYKVSQASAAYHKAEDGHEVTIIIPEEGTPEWAVVENVVGISNDNDEISVTSDEPVPEANNEMSADVSAENKVETVDENLEKEVEDDTSEETETAKPEIKKETPETTAPNEPEEPSEGVKELEI